MQQPVIIKPYIPNIRTVNKTHHTSLRESLAVWCQNRDWLSDALFTLSEWMFEHLVSCLVHINFWTSVAAFPGQLYVHQGPVLVEWYLATSNSCKLLHRHRYAGIVTTFSVSQPTFEYKEIIILVFDHEQEVDRVSYIRVSHIKVSLGIQTQTVTFLYLTASLHQYKGHCHKNIDKRL